MLNCEKTQLSQLLKKLDLFTVSDVKHVEGMYDAVIRLNSHSFDEIKKIIAEKIGMMDDVQTCITLHGAQSFNDIKRL